MLGLDVFTGLQALVAAGKVQAAGEGRPMRSAESFSDIAKAALKGEIARRKKAK